MSGQKRPVDVDTRVARAVRVGELIIGGGFPRTVQTMWKEPLVASYANPEDQEALLSRVQTFSQLGCDLLRFAVPDERSAELLGDLSKRVGMPVVADVHFDHTIAMRCMDFSIAKIRINPGNIGAAWKVSEVVRKARDRGIALRVGVNAGSLPAILRKEADIANAMVKAAEDELNLLEGLMFSAVVFSLKSSDPQVTIDANEEFRDRFDYPLHVGVTEAGPTIEGIVKNTYALTTLLKNGIGDTIRVSLTGPPEEEVLTGRQILRVLGDKRPGVELISCPRCGRSTFNVETFVDQVYNLIHATRKNATVAIMGCPVNGPGEARHADLGVTGTEAAVLIFKHGKVVRRVSRDEAVSAFRKELEEL